MKVPFSTAVLPTSTVGAAAPSPKDAVSNVNALETGASAFTEGERADSNCSYCCYEELCRKFHTKINSLRS